ncbi:2-keto-myo-inositol isomerase [Aequitasia blattaphilus]|uniref:Sugar phosphate isomerase/epimerase n=1 Tax=Aequitasia blattaphilus TaxID=2949332 RepID=A0ABT1ED31_9FIRM|nr:sugar phosphate isomerase/epimerase family protein [Aequitasia blattaphilus]MCP1103584.1 sugar phosphate isomerase/epimerase [Aequitasia blattaphilus]MCR8616224.1 sugar phosphate isomerase/epimerase [Aequitasia blattaphilus]
MLKLGYNEATCKENSNVMRDLELCEKNGYDYIELRLDMLKEYLKYNTLEDLKKFFAGSKLKPFAFNSIENINFCSPKEWEELVNLFTFGCMVAKEINNPYIIVVPTMTDEICTLDEQVVFEDSVEVLNKLADIAEPYGVKLSFEPIGDRRWCCNSVRQALEIVEAVNRDSVGLTVDCINFYMHDKAADIEYIKKIPKDKLFVYHINDCEDLPLGVLDHCNRLMPGLGAIPVKEISEAVKAVGYDGPACLELFRPEYWNMSADEVIKMGAETTKAFL